LGHGADGSVYLGRHIRTNQLSAVKFEFLDTYHPKLANEIDIYSKLSSSGIKISSQVSHVNFSN
jgi:hypothetical protein